MTVPITTQVPITGTPESTSTFGVPVYNDLVALAAAINNPWIDNSAGYVISTTGSATSKGNSTYTSRYKQMGKMVMTQVLITIGSTFGVGSGDYLLPLPVVANGSAVASITGPLLIQDAGTAFRPGTATGFSSTAYKIFCTGVTGGPIGSGGPGTAWGAGDQINVSLLYEAA